MASARLMKRQGPLRESDAAYVFKQAGETCRQRMYGNVRSILDVVCPSLESLKAFYTFYPWFSIPDFRHNSVRHNCMDYFKLRLWRTEFLHVCTSSSDHNGSIAICSACDQNAGLWRCSVLAQQRALFLECGFDTSTRSAQIFGLSSFQKGLSIATSSQRMSSLLGNLGIATLQSYICKTAMLLSTRARSVFTIGHHWTVSKRGTPALISEDFTTAQELGTKVHEVRLTNH